MIAIRLREGRGRFGVVGHVGVGHVHSHSGFVQDDSAGFAVAAGLLKRAMPVDTTIACAEADVDANTITVTTRGGGTATLSPRRGVTPAEAELLERAAGRDGFSRRR